MSYEFVPENIVRSASYEGLLGNITNIAALVKPINPEKELGSILLNDENKIYIALMFSKKNAYALNLDDASEIIQENFRKNPDKKIHIFSIPIEKTFIYKVDGSNWSWYASSRKTKKLLHNRIKKEKILSKILS